jgi:hypothetical protein
MYGNKLSHVSLLLALTLCSFMAGALLINPAFAAIVSLGGALDNTTITWITSGSNGMAWYGQTTTSYYGGDSAQSGDIDNNQFSSLRFNTGYVSYYYGMYVRFVWKVSSEAKYDNLSFYIDYDLMDNISGEVGWQTKTYYIPGPPTGYHTLEWEYTKDGSVSAGADAGWVDHVEVFTAWAAPNVAEAVDNTALTWQTFFSGSGWNPYWKGETFISVYGGDAAQSGAVSTNSYSYLRTSVTGPGTLKFYWKVSSGTGDYLIFYIDNVAQNSIGGNVDWQQKTFTITSGLHTLQWNYAKDMYSVTDAGSDCGWVDKVEFTPSWYSATIWSWCAIEGWLARPITKDGVPTGYSTPHTFTGLTGTHTFTVPSTDSAGHPFSDWSTDWTDRTITVSSAGTYTARYRAGYSVTIWSWCAIEGWLSRPITKDGVSTGYSTPHTFAGLTGTHTFKVPSTDASGHTFYEWSTGWTGTTLTVTSAGVYTARYKLGTTALTVKSPNGGQKWIRGTTHTLTWSSSGSPGAYVKIELMKSGVLNKVIASSTANDGSYSWTIPSTQTLGTDYKIRITSTSNAAITDSSNSNFAIVAGTLTVTSPNGGESWKRGTVHTITWSKSGSLGSYVKIELLKGGVVNRVITSSTANDGSYSWTIPSTQTAGTDYKIRITSTTYSSISDSSNSNFKITT